MQRMLKAVTGLALGITAVAGTAQAQNMSDQRSVSFGIAGGATVPVGDLGDGYNTGYNVMGSLGFQPMYLPIGARFDVMYHSLGSDFGGDDLSILAGNANAVLTISNTAGVRPYVLGGVGIYNLDAGEGLLGSDNSVTKFGLNGGGGLEFALSGFNTFVEARFHSVFTEGGNSNLVPIVFGIKF